MEVCWRKKALTTHKQNKCNRIFTKIFTLISSFLPLLPKPRTLVWGTSPRLLRQNPCVYVCRRGTADPQPLRISRSLAKAEFSVKSFALFLWWRVYEACSQICSLTDEPGNPFYATINWSSVGLTWLIMLEGWKNAIHLFHKQRLVKQNHYGEIVNEGETINANTCWNSMPSICQSHF